LTLGEPLPRVGAVDPQLALDGADRAVTGVAIRFDATVIDGVVDVVVSEVPTPSLHPHPVLVDDAALALRPFGGTP
jgi:hypothetical protein